MQTHFDPKRADDPHVLPDCEVFHMSARNIRDYGPDSVWYTEDGEPMKPGWYYWACFPGCPPDSDPAGPFATEAEALADAQSDYDDESEG